MFAHGLSALLFGDFIDIAWQFVELSRTPVAVNEQSG
jgi:hypothetical protein